jgi:GNAT superfamily N-acetyltransferase
MIEFQLSKVFRLTPVDAGELFTLQLAAWVREGRENGTIDIPPLQEELADVVRQLGDARLTIWGYRDAGRLLATARTSLIDDDGALLGRLGVVPDLSRQGLGGAMLGMAEARLPDSVRRIELMTGIGSVSNHRFYARHGYAIVKRDPAVGVVHLVKHLPLVVTP